MSISRLTYLSSISRYNKVQPTNTTSNGLWTLNEIRNYINANTWPRGPVAPTSLSVSSGNTQLSISWTAPATTHGTITNYLVEYTPSGGSAVTVLTGSNGTSYTLTGLTNGTSYTVRVAAVNFKSGDYTASSSAVTPVASTTPGVPTSLTATSGNAQVALSWTAPASDGGAAITDYAVQFSSNSGSSWTTFADGTSTATSATVTGLTNGTAYVFRVAAVNSVGTGTYTAASGSVTPTAGISLVGATSGSGTVSDPYVLNNVTASATGSAAIQWQRVQTGGGGCDYGEHVTLERRNSSNALISANDRRSGVAQISNPVTLNTGDKLETYNDCADGYYRVWFV